MSTPLNDALVDSQAKGRSDRPGAPDTRLQGRWLALIRVAWVVLSVLAFIIFIASLPGYFTDQLKSYLVGYAVFLLALGIFVASVWFFVALLIFWRKSNDWLALLVSSMLVLQGANTTINPLHNSPSLWLLPAVIQNQLAFFVLLLILCLFPTGRFVPRWIGWLAVMVSALWLAVLLDEIFDFLPVLNNRLFILVLYCLFGGFVVAQLYRYHSVSNRIERQQTKSIVFGVTTTYLIEFLFSFSSVLFQSVLSSTSLAIQFCYHLGTLSPSSFRSPLALRFCATGSGTLISSFAARWSTARSLPVWLHSTCLSSSGLARCCKHEATWACPCWLQASLPCSFSHCTPVSSGL